MINIEFLMPYFSLELNIASAFCIVLPVMCSSENKHLSDGEFELNLVLQLTPGDMIFARTMMKSGTQNRLHCVEPTILWFSPGLGI